MMAALCWFGLDWAGNTDAPALIRAAGLVAASLTLPLLGWVVAATQPLGTWRMARNALMAIGAALMVLSVLWIATWVPALDPRCLAICDLNPFGFLADFRLARNLATHGRA